MFKFLKEQLFHFNNFHFLYHPEQRTKSSERRELCKSNKSNSMTGLQIAVTA